MRDWTTKLAIIYSREIRDELGDCLYDVINQNNEYQEQGIECDAAHDYCDANMVMNHAFEKLFKREINVGNEEDLKLVNDAWKLSLEHEYFNVEDNRW
jgi:NTP pyrophosphatase (non-canonical NTP hydrolase)